MNINKQMTDLTKQLKRCRVDPTTTQDEIDDHFIKASQQTLQQTHDTVSSLVAEIQQREQAIIKEIEEAVEIRRKEKEKRMEYVYHFSEKLLKRMISTVQHC